VVRTVGRGKRERPGHRGGDAVDWHGARGSDEEGWDKKNPEDDPFRDLRPQDEERPDPANEEYEWPDMKDENEEDEDD
jgi:hypothetical protein